MQRQLSKWLLGVTFGGAALVSVASWAMGPPGGMPHDPTHMVAHLAHKLDLSEQQRTDIEGIMVSSRDAARADHQRMRQLRQELKGQTEQFDAGRAQQLADELGAITARMVYQFTSNQAGIYQLLDEEQRAAMASLIEQREERRDRWREGPRRGAKGAE